MSYENLMGNLFKNIKKVLNEFKFKDTEAIILGMLVAKKFNLATNNLFINKLFQHKQYHPLVSLKIFHSNIEPLTRIEIRRKIRYEFNTIKKLRKDFNALFQIVKNIEVQFSSQIIAEIFYEFLTRVSPLFIEYQVFDSLSGPEILSFLVTLCERLSIPIKTIGKFFKVELEDSRVKLWKKIAYYIVTYYSKRPDVLNQRKKTEEELKALFKKYPDINLSPYFIEMRILNDFWNQIKEKEKQKIVIKKKGAISNAK